MADTSGSLDAALGQVKKWGAASLRVTLCDGEEKDVAISKRRNKWTALSAVLRTLDWAKIEGLDAKGGILRVYENPDVEAFAVGDLDAIEEGAPKELAYQATLVKIMLAAQDVALRRQREMMGTVQDCSVAMMQMMSERLVHLEKSYSDYLEVLRDMAQAPIGMESDKMMEMIAPHVVKRVMAADTSKGGSNNG